MTHVEHIPAGNTVLVAHKLDAAAWGLFFVWVGVALIADVGWGVGLLGAGVITLGAQWARTNFDLAIEGFRVAVGLLFALGGAWEIVGVQFSLVPMLLILAGGALLLHAVRGVKV